MYVLVPADNLSIVCSLSRYGPPALTAAASRAYQKQPLKWCARAEVGSPFRGSPGTRLAVSNFLGVHSYWANLLDAPDKYRTLI